MKWSAYWQIARFDKPIGIALLWFPTAWGLWLANHGHPPAKLVILFLIGTILMRAAGCVINDIADRNIDRHVIRTKNRPLTAGTINMAEAFLLLFLLFSGALSILFCLPPACFPYAITAVFISILYPFCKRFLAAPQLILGLAFSMGIPMAYVASAIPFNTTTWLLFFNNFLWIIAYDTQYAMVDRPDDLKIGVRSTAVLFAQYDKIVILCLQIVFHLMWFSIYTNEGVSPLFYYYWLAASFILIYQNYLLASGKEENYFKAFKSNAYYGLLMWMACI